MGGHIRIGGKLHVPLVGIGVPAEHVLEPIPFEAEAHRAVKTVNGRPGPDSYAVLLVNDLVFLLVVELVHNDLCALVGKCPTAGGEIQA